jgi:hypothetical protein
MKLTSEVQSVAWVIYSTQDALIYMSYYPAPHSAIHESINWTWRAYKASLVRSLPLLQPATRKQSYTANSQQYRIHKSSTEQLVLNRQRKQTRRARRAYCSDHTYCCLGDPIQCSEGGFRRCGIVDEYRYTTCAPQHVRVGQNEQRPRHAPNAINAGHERAM